jgi:Ca2+-binding RTX toxin-like protein
MARFLLLLALLLSLAFAGTALATEDDELYDGADVCAIDDGEDLIEDEEDLEEEDDFFEDEEDFEGEEDLGDEEDLFRAFTATNEDDCEPETGSDPATDATSGPAPGTHRPRGTRGDDRLVGTNGRDRLSGRRGDDFLDGRGAADNLTGGPGDDEIVTGRASKAARAAAKVTARGDRVVAGGGTDVVRARNGARDRINCGRGRDTVYAETGDRVRKNCETVKYS